jgi:chorismate--pyruvate lyase
MSEHRALGMKQGDRAVIREVRLMCGDTPWVFARTVIPVRSLRGAQRRLIRLGSKPLGAALFADPGLRRGEVEVARMSPGEQLFARAVGSATSSKAVWGRRSVFWLQGKPLLVSEIFLPALLEAHSQT